MTGSKTLQLQGKAHTLIQGALPPTRVTLLVTSPPCGWPAPADTQVGSKSSHPTCCVTSDDPHVQSAASLHLTFSPVRGRQSWHVHCRAAQVSVREHDLTAAGGIRVACPVSLLLSVPTGPWRLFPRLCSWRGRSQESGGGQRLQQPCASRGLPQAWAVPAALYLPGSPIYKEPRRQPSFQASRL